MLLTVRRAQVGLKKADKRRGTGYHPLERLWIRNYEQQNPNCTGREVTNSFNAMFAGATLPGEMEPRPKRSLAAIACHRLRRPEAEKYPVKKRTAEEAGLSSEENDGDGTSGTQDRPAEQEDGNSGEDRQE